MLLCHSVRVAGAFRWCTEASERWAAAVDQREDRGRVWVGWVGWGRVVGGAVGALECHRVDVSHHQEGARGVAQHGRVSSNEDLPYPQWHCFDLACVFLGLAPSDICPE